MGFQLINLRINRVITHQIFKRGQDREPIPPKYSNDYTELDQEGLNVLQERTTEALGSDSHCIDMLVKQENPESTFNKCCRIITADKPSFIQLTDALALKLTESQNTRNIPGGVLIIFDGLVGNENNRYVGIIKAEIHAGFNLQDLHGKLLLKFLSNLALTPDQKLFKIAMFIEIARSDKPELRTPNDFKILVYDHLMTKAETRQAAQYFYEAFLGCCFPQSDKKLTGDFYHGTKEYIQSLNIADDKKVDLNTSLYTYLKVSQSPIVKIADFATQYLDQQYRDGYQNFMDNKGLPANAFNKDITNIESYLKRRNIKFSSNVRISAPSDRFKELVNIISQEAGKTIVSIEGHIEKDD